MRPVDHLEMELAGIASRLEFLERIRDQRAAYNAATPGKHHEELQTQVDELQATVKKLSKIVEQQQRSIEELIFGEED